MNALPDDQETGGVLLLTARQVAKLMQISQRTLWRLVSAGAMLPPIKLGRSVRWRAEQVREWISKGCPVVRKRKEKGE